MQKGSCLDPFPVERHNLLRKNAYMDVLRIFGIPSPKYDELRSMEAITEAELRTVVIISQ